MSSFTTTTTRMGETWDMISKRLYGTEYRMSDLIVANPSYRDVAVFSGGTVIVAPVYDDDASLVSSSLPPWKR